MAVDATTTARFFWCDQRRHENDRHGVQRPIRFESVGLRHDQIEKNEIGVEAPCRFQRHHLALGYIAYRQRNYADAVSHFEMAHPDLSVYTKYLLAKSNEAAGNKDKAEALYKDISTYNVNGIGYALVRNEVVSRKPAM